MSNIICYPGGLLRLMLLMRIEHVRRIKMLGMGLGESGGVPAFIISAIDRENLRGSPAQARGILFGVSPKTFN